MLLDLNMSHGKMFDFVSFLLFPFWNVNFENHWNALIFLDKKDMLSDLNVHHGKMFDFDSFPMFETEKFQFWKLLKYFNISW